MKKVLIIFVLASMIAVLNISCEKFLDEKPDQKLVVPSSLADFQALLDNFGIMSNVDLASLEISADDYYVTDTDLAALSSEANRRMYNWQKDYLFVPQSNDWSNAYRAIYYCNVVLTGLERSGLNRDAAFKNLMGQALVFRAKCFLQAVSLWGLAYKSSDDASPGIPLRVDENFNSGSVRATLKESYNQIVEDLTHAIPLLSDKSTHPYRPGKAAAYGLLSRTYLYMGKYNEAEINASLCLKIYPDIIDYNIFNPADRYPFPLYTTEVIFDTYTPAATIMGSSRGKIVPELMNSYEPNDLRKGLFYLITSGFYYFKGTYNQPALFFGVATDELYLNQAECLVRRGEVNAAVDILNKLLVKRYKSGTYIPLTITEGAVALDRILLERRKELVMRGLRWMDIKRLNAEGKNITLTRVVNGISYSLLPNDKRYALPIPEDVIALTGMPQNDR